MRKLHEILSIVLVLFIAAPAATRAVAAQPRAQDDAIRLKADLVTITASVIDRNGRANRTLKASDFTVYEDGVKQRIAHFATTEEPFTVLLLLDLSGSTRDDLSLIKRAASKFLAELRREDSIGVIAFSGEAEKIADPRDSRSSVEAAVDRLDTPPDEEGYRFSSKTGTAFYDAISLAVEQIGLKQAEGRKAIVCMSDGVDSTSKRDYRDIARLAEESEASIYFLQLNTEEATLDGLLRPKSDPGYINFSQSQVNRYYDEYDPGSPDRHRPRQAISPLVRREINTGLYEMARREQKELAERTGGHIYPVSALTDLAAIFKQVASDLRSQYSISYYPSNDKHDGRWRSIRVEVRQDAKVRARSGYWAK